MAKGMSEATGVAASLPASGFSRKHFFYPPSNCQSIAIPIKIASELFTKFLKTFSG